MNPLTKYLYDNYLAICSANVADIKSFTCSLGCYSKVTYFTPLLFNDDTLFHVNIFINKYLYKIITFCTTGFGLVIAVNIHFIVAFLDKLLNKFSLFFLFTYKEMQSLLWTPL